MSLPSFDELQEMQPQEFFSYLNDTLPDAKFDIEGKKLSVSQVSAFGKDKKECPDDAVVFSIGNPPEISVIVSPVAGYAQIDDEKMMNFSWPNQQYFNWEVTKKSAVDGDIAVEQYITDVSGWSNLPSQFWLDFNFTEQRNSDGSFKGEWKSAVTPQQEAYIFKKQPDTVSKTRWNKDYWQDNHTRDSLPLMTSEFELASNDVHLTSKPELILVPEVFMALDLQKNKNTYLMQGHQLYNDNHNMVDGNPIRIVDLPSNQITRRSYIQYSDGTKSENSFEYTKLYAVPYAYLQKLGGQ